MKDYISAAIYAGSKVGETEKRQMTPRTLFSEALTRTCDLSKNGTSDMCYSHRKPWGSDGEAKY